MYIDPLQQTGLSTDAAAVYEALLTSGPAKAAELAERTGIARGMLYNAVDQLIEAKLAAKQGTIICPCSPEAILTILELRARKAEKLRDQMRNSLPPLKKLYLKNRALPLIRYFDGAEGLKKIYEDLLTSGATSSFFIRAHNVSAYDIIGHEWMKDFMIKRSKAGIITHNLCVDDPAANHDAARDEKRTISRKWINLQDYTQPVEFMGYGDCVAIMSFGAEIFGVIIEHPEIARAFSELFALAEKGADTITVNHNHP